MQGIKTADGSVTFRNVEISECYHTMSGALEEAFEKFAKPCRIGELAKNGRIVIFDVCFGLGYNSAAAIDIIMRANPKCRIVIYGFENDQDILDKILEVSPGFESYGLIKKIAKTHEIEEDGARIKIFLGDARAEIRKMREKADAVFFDPFSPQKAPWMWEEEFFSDISKKMRKGAVLATYSYAKAARNNLKSAGFEVKDGPVIGRRSPSTIAINSGEFSKK